MLQSTGVRGGGGVHSMWWWWGGWGGGGQVGGAGGGALVHLLTPSSAVPGVVRARCPGPWRWGRGAQHADRQGAMGRVVCRLQPLCGRCAASLRRP